MQTSRFGLAALLLGSLLLSGCAGYRLGPTAGQVAGARSIRIPPARNNTLEPRLTQPVTEALRRQMQQDGTLRLETESGVTDLILEATIEDYERLPLAFQRGDVISVLEYELRIRVHVKVTQQGREEPLLDRQVMGRTTVLAEADQTSVERQAAPLLANDFARKAVLLVTEGSW